MVLTPGHFLTGRSLLTFPEEDNTHDNMNHLQRWRLVQSIHQHFWKRWHRKYLHTLQSRGKWTIPQKNLSSDHLVLVQNYYVRPLCWCMARVVEVFPGKNNLVRVAIIKTANGELVRPVNQQFPPLAGNFELTVAV
ncbi:hypothetical protein PR048_010088 [Dryococelus australis]|uniref:DUF5641 domain-containing protein n=1 Tax=Dryococelus australis TaxID=614101 RepID=A0ABQ9I1Q7_9NEOP|nr:hypothetical protein PR048_010088 [Dryococelus australis]